MYKDIPIKSIKETTKAPKYLNKDLTDGDSALLNNLKSLRLDIAKKQNLPAFTIFHDSTLIQMSQRRPKNEIDMLEIDGVGPAKLKKYGLIFIDLISKHSKHPWTKNHGPMRIYDRTKGSGKLSFISFNSFLLFP